MAPSKDRRLAECKEHGLIDKLVQSDEQGGFERTIIDELFREVCSHKTPTRMNQVGSRFGYGTTEGQGITHDERKR
jgi:hypothetical protein